jgi:copper chaperone CopZ
MTERTINLEVFGLKRLQDATALEQALAKEKGIQRAEVIFTTSTARVTIDSEETSLRDVKNTFKTLGYEVR